MTDVEEQPQFDTLSFRMLEMWSIVFLGRFEASGTKFDLWYTLYNRPDAVASIYAVHSNENRRDFWNRMVGERAGVYSRHGVHDKLASWAPGANLALDEADRRVAERRLPLNPPISH